MSGTYLDSNEDITFWDDVSTLKSRVRYPEEEMALITADRSNAGSKYNALTSPSKSTALVKWESPNKRRSSYNFNEVATNLQNSAEQALEEPAPSSNNGYRQDSISRGVARIVLEEGNKAVDSSKEYIAGVVRKVARYAQDVGHDGETSGSAANQVIQPRGTTSLGTMMSFFVIWCVSLCASHMDSKDLPAPALKLAAEEVASVLQSTRSSRSGTAL
ncbi:hypothetical protein M758_8G167900 [Ceratodon purpureus]|uniref:Uncharacterized protein n=1 Tax=Ceratodon purpureus TaxID=3225 RepID=A0A8T0H487_CERPU|nr:hypothetical protein KC19_8G173100 [Ceratodon purpureus]KAG0609224.1 hypothetical protein M758_8G167900 [Ceratodon purpureus]